MLRRRYQSWLVPYVEGTLDSGRRAKLEARLARDSALATEAEALRRTIGRVRAAASQEHRVEASEADESVLWPRIEARLRPNPRVTRGQWAWAGGLCAASALAWGVTLGPLATHRSPQIAPPQGVQSVANVTQLEPPKGTEIAPKSSHVRSPRRVKAGGGAVRRPNRTKVRVRPAAEEVRPEERLAVNSGLPADTQTPPDTTPSVRTAEGKPGGFHLATALHESGHEEQGDERDGNAPETSGAAGADSSPNASDSAPAESKTDEAGPKTSRAPEAGSRSRSSRHRRHTRRHRRHETSEKGNTVQTPPVLPPDTPPAAQTTAEPKHKVSRPGYID